MGAVVELPTSGGVVLTGRLAAGSQSWLSDHAVGGVVIFPGAGFVELAIRAGDEVGCSVVDELTLHAPLVIPPTVRSRCRSSSTRADESGSRAVSVFSRADARLGMDPARRRRSRPGAVEPGADCAALATGRAHARRRRRAYERLAARGYGYGPAFQGLTAMWRRGDEIFAECHARRHRTCRQPVSGCTRRFSTPPCTR